MEVVVRFSTFGEPFPHQFLLLKNPWTSAIEIPCTNRGSWSMYESTHNSWWGLQGLTITNSVTPVAAAHCWARLVAEDTLSHGKTSLALLNFSLRKGNPKKLLRKLSHPGMPRIFSFFPSFLHSTKGYFTSQTMENKIFFKVPWKMIAVVINCLKLPPKALFFLNTKCWLDWIHLALLNKIKLCNVAFGHICFGGTYKTTWSCWQVTKGRSCAINLIACPPHNFSK